METNYPTLTIQATDGPLLSFLYHNALGRLILKPLVQPFVSVSIGFILDSSLSKGLISGFIKKNDLDLADYQKQTYGSFNDFFKRDILPEARPYSLADQDIPAPCDGKVTAYQIAEDSHVTVKKAVYNVAQLLQNETLAREYLGGTMVILRLTPDDYHHYRFLDEGKILTHSKIAGVLHTVRPVSASHEKVYINNSREVTVMATKNVGKVTQIEVGALLVGKIANQQCQGSFKRFDKKGYFEFGGSTIILLFQKAKIALVPELLSNTEQNKETIIKMGQKIGKGEGEVNA